MKKNINQIVTTIVFVLFIFGFTIATLVVDKKEFSENENRTLAKAPKFTFKSLISGEFATKYETYLTDQFVMRDEWIAIKTLAEMGLGKKDINQVYLSKDNYLIEKQDSSLVDEAKAYTNCDRMIEFVSKYSDKLGNDRVKAMLVPTASDILEDKLPSFATTYNQDLLIDYVAAGLGERFVDVRKVLKDHKNEYIFYKTDHHWTMLGAYYAYENWAEEMGLKAYKKDDFTVNSSKGFKGTIYSKINFALETDTIDYYEAKFPMKYKVTYEKDGKVFDSMFALEHLNKKDKYPVYLDGNHALVQVDTNLNTGRKLLIIKDSYAHCFATLAANHYDTTYLVDFRYFRQSISEFIEANGVTDILVLYNCATFSGDNYTKLFLK